MTTKTLMRAAKMNEEQIERHEALVLDGYRVREVKGGYDLVHEGLEIHRGPFATREAAWDAAEESAEIEARITDRCRGDNLTTDQQYQQSVNRAELLAELRAT